MIRHVPREYKTNVVLTLIHCAGGTCEEATNSGKAASSPNRIGTGIGAKTTPRERPGAGQPQRGDDGGIFNKQTILTA